MATTETQNGVEYDPQALDTIEHCFWRELWESLPEAVAAEHGVELARFGPVQANVVRELGHVRMLNLVLGAAEPGAVAGGHLEDALTWTRERGASPYVPLTPGLPTSADA